jgi:hypothetical protein
MSPELSLDEELLERVRQTIGAGKSMLTVFFNPNDFVIVNFLPQEDSFAAQYFIDQMVKPLSQEYSMKSVDFDRRSLRLPFDNSRCHTVEIASEEMNRLKCKRVPYPPYSPDLTIADFHLFGVLKQKLQSIDESQDKELKNEALKVVQSTPSDELKTSFDHWIERCQ